MHPDPRAQEGVGTPAAPSPSQAGLATPDAEAGSPLTKPAGLTRPVHSCPLPSGLPSPAPSGMFPKFLTRLRPAIWRVAAQGGETLAMRLRAAGPSRGGSRHPPPLPLRKALPPEGGPRTRTRRLALGERLLRVPLVLAPCRFPGRTGSRCGFSHVVAPEQRGAWPFPAGVLPAALSCRRAFVGTGSTFAGILFFYSGGASTAWM